MEKQLDPSELIFSQFEYALSVIEKCTDDYIFILDLKNDCYSISDTAVERFPLPGGKFGDVTNVLKGIIHPDDYDMISINLDEIAKGRTTEHNFEYRWLTRDGSYAWISCRGQVVLGKDSKAQYLVGRIAEIGSMQKADNITGLKTETQLDSDYKALLEANPKMSGFFLRVKIDNFRELNRRFGKSMGDIILQEMGKIIEAVSVNGSLAYRFDNSSFIIFNCIGGTIDDASEIYNNIRRMVETTAKRLDYKAFFTVSAGITDFKAGKAPKLDDLYRKTEFAIYSSIDKGGNDIEIFSQDAYDEYIRSLEIRENLRRSVNDNFNGFELYYQPIISAETMSVLGAEALLRWENSIYGRLSPVEFIPILEESGLIVPVGKWIFQTAIKQCKLWQKYIPNFKMNINLSYVQLRSSDILDDIQKCIEENELDPRYIVVEITESGHLDMDSSLIDSFRKKQFKLAIDDFGTGYSNMRYLQYLNANIIKIDRSFVSLATKSAYDFKIVKYIIDMAHGVNMDVCLEGIETIEEINTFLPLKPNFFQGYHFGRPVPSAEFYENHLKNYQ